MISCYLSYSTFFNTNRPFNIRTNHTCLSIKNDKNYFSKTNRTFSYFIKKNSIKLKLRSCSVTSLYCITETDIPNTFGRDLNFFSRCRPIPFGLAFVLDCILVNVLLLLRFLLFVATRVCLIFCYLCF
jgi:hypothetical protein